LKTLVVSFFFPPYNTIGAVRVDRTASWLLRYGHDVRVVTAQRQPFPATLRPCTPQDRIIATPWLDFGGIVGGPQTSSEALCENPAAISRGRNALRTITRNLVYYPDRYVGWFPWAVRAASASLRTDPSDVVLASGGPWTSLLVASAAAKKFDIPWVADFRDLWTDNPYVDRTALQSLFDRVAENRVLSSCSGIVTVSEQLASYLEVRHGRPVIVVRNAFDAVSDSEHCIVPESEPLGDELSILYTGKLYEGKRDPSVLFEAIQGMGERGRQVRIRFLGTPEKGLVRRLAEKHDVEDVVQVDSAVSHADAAAAQRRCDVLLLILGTSVRDHGIPTGKLFEYIGARRPILAVNAASRSEAARIVSDHGLGVVAPTVKAVQSAIEEWLAIKARVGRVPSTPRSAIEPFARSAQVKTLDSFLRELT